MLDRRVLARLERDGYTLRSRDVAWILDCSPDDVIEFARRQRLKAKKLGRFWRFRLKDVRQYQKNKGLQGG